MQNKKKEKELAKTSPNPTFTDSMSAKDNPTDIIAVRVEKVKKIRVFTPSFRTC